MNRERVLTDAKQRALELVHEGYRVRWCRAPIFLRRARAFWRR